MISEIRIFTIRKEALNSLRKDNNGTVIRSVRSILLYYYCVPFFFSVLLILFGANVTPEIATFFITGISIFAGLFFNLLLVVAEKANDRKSKLDLKKEQKTKINESFINYVKRYSIFSEKLISQISHCISLSIILIVLMFLTYLKELRIDPITLDNYWFNSINFKIILDFLIFVIGAQFLILITVILSNIYSMLLEDVKFNR